MNRATSVYTVTFGVSEGKVLDWVIGGLPHSTLCGSGFNGNGTAFMRIRVKDDQEAVLLADRCMEGVSTNRFEIHTGVGIHRRVVDLDNIRRTLNSQD